MGDPVTMAMIGAGVGAITNPRKPLQGALLGGALGGFGGAAMGAGNAAATATMTGASAAPIGVATPGMALPAQGAGYFATPTMPATFATGGSTGLIPSMTAPVTMADRFKALGTFNRENPMVGQVGSSALRDIMQPTPVMASAPTPGLLRGTPAQEQPQQYAMQMPQVSLI